MASFVRGVVAHVLNKVAFVGMSDDQFQRAVRDGMRPHEDPVVEFRRRRLDTSN